MKIKHLVITFLTILALTGCSTFMVQKIVLPDNAVILDVRTAEDFKKDHVEGAILVPHDKIDASIKKQIPCTSTPVFIYCQKGVRAKIAEEKLEKLGYTNLTVLGGIEEAKKKIVRGTGK